MLRMSIVMYFFFRGTPIVEFLFSWPSKAFIFSITLHVFIQQLLIDGATHLWSQLFEAISLFPFSIPPSTNSFTRLYNLTHHPSALLDKPICASYALIRCIELASTMHALFFLKEEEDEKTVFPERKRRKKEVAEMEFRTLDLIQVGATKQALTPKTTVLWHMNIFFENNDLEKFCNEGVKSHIIIISSNKIISDKFYHLIKLTSNFPKMSQLR